MKKSFKIIGAVLLAAMMMFACACNGKSNQKVYDGEAGNGKKTASYNSSAGKDEPGCYADIEVKDLGVITVKLDKEAAPKSVENFVNLANSGFYDGLTFHRIIKDFMMQGGAWNGSGTAPKNIVGEFAANGIENNISHKRGVISMARANDYNSGSSQFFIVHEDSEFLDGNYAAFGYVTAGMDIVDEICNSARPVDNNGTIPKAEQPIINSVRITEK